MVSTGISLPHQPSPWWLVLLLTALAALGLWFVSHNVFHYAQYDAKTYGD